MRSFLDLNSRVAVLKNIFSVGILLFVLLIADTEYVIRIYDLVRFNRYTTKPPEITKIFRNLNLNPDPRVFGDPEPWYSILLVRVENQNSQFSLLNWDCERKDYIDRSIFRFYMIQTLSRWSPADQAIPDKFAKNYFCNGGTDNVFEKFKSVQFFRIVNNKILKIQDKAFLCQ